jgi:hypothetical protein
VPGDVGEYSPSGTGGKVGLRDALAAEQAAEAARAMGCGDAGMETAEQVIRAGLLKFGGSMLEQLLAADRGRRGPSVPYALGTQDTEQDPGDGGDATASRAS